MYEREERRLRNRRARAREWENQILNKVNRWRQECEKVKEVSGAVDSTSTEEINVKEIRYIKKRGDMKEKSNDEGDERAGKNTLSLGKNLL